MPTGVRVCPRTPRQWRARRRGSCFTTGEPRTLDGAQVWIPSQCADPMEVRIEQPNYDHPNGARQPRTCHLIRLARWWCRRWCLVQGLRRSGLPLGCWSCRKEVSGGRHWNDLQQTKLQDSRISAPTAPVLSRRGTPAHSVTSETGADQFGRGEDDGPARRLARLRVRTLAMCGSRSR